MNIELLGWLATIILLVGYLLNARKSICSWIVWFHGNALMLIYALAIESYSVACGLPKICESAHVDLESELVVHIGLSAVESI